MIKNDKRRIIKLLPCPFVYVEHIEKWLDDFALKGYELVKIKRGYAEFNESEKREVNYHIHFCSENNEEENILVQNGYELLLDNNSSAKLRYDKSTEVWIYSKDIKASCNIEDSETKKKAIVQDIRGMLYPLLTFLVVLMYNFIRIIKFRHNEWNTEFLMLFFCFSLPIILLGIINVLIFLRRRALIKYYKGKAPLPKSPNKRVYRITSIAHNILILLMIINLIALSMVLVFDGVDTTKTEDILTIKAIEGEYSKYLPEEHLDEYEDTHIFHTIVMPKFYYLYDYVTTNENESDESIYYCVEYARYNIKKLADISYDRWFSVRGVHYKYAEIKNYAVTYYKDLEDDILYLILKNDYEVIDIIYSGNRTPTEVIENIEENFSKRQN